MPAFNFLGVQKLLGRRICVFNDSVGVENEERLRQRLCYVARKPERGEFRLLRADFIGDDTLDRQRPFATR